MNAATSDPNFYPSDDEDETAATANESTASENDDQEELDEHQKQIEQQEELDERQKQIEQQRIGAKAAQVNQANKMLETSNKRFNFIICIPSKYYYLNRFGPIQKGTNVRIPIDPVDRPKLGHHNLIGVVIDINEHGLYKIGTKNGQLPQCFSRNQLEPQFICFSPNYFIYFIVDIILISI